jgi:hypothetical protein
VFLAGGEAGSGFGVVVVVGFSLWHGLLAGDDGVFALLGGLEDGIGGLVDEEAAVFAEGADEGCYLAGCQ